MSLALMLSALISSMVIGAPPAPCPPGEARVPIGVVAGTVQSTCKPIEEIETSTASADELAHYAAQEKAAAPKVDDFRGGSVVIYLSAGAAIVLLVLLILLL